MNNQPVRMKDALDVPETIYLEDGPLAGRRKVIEQGDNVITYPDAPGEVYRRAKPDRLEQGEPVFVHAGKDPSAPQYPNSKK